MNDHGELWTARRHALLELLERGPARLPAAYFGHIAHCMDTGLVDWIRDINGRIIYGDQRRVLTPHGYEVLLSWRAAGRVPWEDSAPSEESAGKAE